MIKYRFTCDCEYEVQVIKDLESKKGIRWVCPIHKTFILRMVCECCICGEAFSAKHANSAYCSESCRAIGEKHRDKMYYERTKVQKKGYSKSSKVCPRNDDCKYYFNCIAIPGGKLLDDPKACQSCSRYRKRDTSDDILQHISAPGDSFATANI